MLETERLLLRRWQVEEAHVQRELWSERDLRVPAHRRIDAEGRPSVEDIARWIGAADPPSGTRPGLLAIERKATNDVIGYCGIVDGEPGADPELAYELLRRTWGHGYATEAAGAVLDWADGAGYERLAATVWDWNTASLRVLAKLGFEERSRTVVPSTGATNVVLVRA